MILTGKTIPQLPQLTATTNTSILPIHLLGTTYYSTVLDFIKSTPFGTFYQNLLPISSNTFSIGSSTYKLSSITTNDVSTTNLSASSINLYNSANNNYNNKIEANDTSITFYDGDSNQFFQIDNNSINIGTGSQIGGISTTNLTSTKQFTLPDKNGTFAMLTDITGNTVGGGSEIFISASSANSTFRSLSSQTPTNLNITTNDGLILFSGKTFYDNASNSGSGQQVLLSSTIPNLRFRTLSSTTPTNLNITTSGNDILFSAKTFITGATNLDAGIGIFKSADTQTLSFKSLSSSTSALTISNTSDNVVFNIRPKYYGSFQDFNSQSITTNNVGVPMLFRTVDFNNGISIVSGVSGYSQITFSEAGVYNLQFSSQFENTGNSEYNVYIWLRRQGIDFPGSAGYFTIHRLQSGNPGVSLAAWNYLLQVTGTTDYYELVWSTNNAANVNMKYYAAGNPPPAAASVILTVTEV